MPVAHVPAMASSHVVGQTQATTMPVTVKNERDSVLHPISAGNPICSPGGLGGVAAPPPPSAHSQQPISTHQRARSAGLPPSKPPQNTGVSSAHSMNPATGLLVPKQEVPAKDPVDISSIRGLFGWATIDGISIPHLLREDKQYVAVRIVEQKLLARFPNTFPEELGEHEPLVSYYVTQNELKLLDEINAVHCNYDYGHHQFTNKDLIVKLSEFEDFYNLVKRTFPEEVLEARRVGLPLMQPAELAKSKSGWIQVNNTVTPYFRRNTVKYVVLQIIKHAAKLLTNVDVASILPDDEEYRLINDMCQKAGLAFQFAKKTRLVSLEDVKQHHKVTLMELPMEAPMKYAQYNADTKTNEENRQTSQMTTPKYPNPVAAPPSVQGGQPFPGQHNASYPPQGMVTTMGLPRTTMGLPRFPGNVPVTQRPAGAGSPFMGVQYPVSSTTGMQYPVRNPSLPNMNNMNQQRMATGRPPPPYPGGQVRPGNSPGMNQIADMLAQKRAASELRMRHAYPAQEKTQGQVARQPMPPQNATRSSLSMDGSGRTISSGMVPNGSHPPPQGYRQPVLPDPNMQQQHRQMNPAQAAALQTMRAPLPPGQQQAQYLYPYYNQAQVGVSTMPRMNNILQRPPFQSNLSNHYQHMQGILNCPPGNLQNIPNVQNSQLPTNNSVLLKQALGSQQVALPQPPHSVPPVQQTAMAPVASNFQSSVANTNLSTFKAQAPSMAPSLQPGMVKPAQINDMPGYVDASKMPTQRPILPPPAKQSNPVFPQALPPVSVTSQVSNINKCGSADSDLKTKEPDKPSTKPTDIKTLPTPITTEAAEVVKISSCITGVRFEGKSISCLEYESLSGKHALIEAVSKLYFPECNLNEFIFALEQVLEVPTSACEPNEEKAFIHYYSLPVAMLKCNKMVKLEDLSKYYPQLSYMFSKKNDSGNSGALESLKTMKPVSGGGAQVDDDTSGVIFVEQRSPNVAEKGSVSNDVASAPEPGVRPSGAAKRKHYSGPGQPSKQPRRLEDAVERLKMKPESSATVNNADSPDGSLAKNKPSGSTEDSVIVIE